MNKDLTDSILEQWSAQKPDLDTAPLGVVVRVLSLYRSFSRDAARALEPLGLELFEYDVLSALRRQGEPFELPATRLAKQSELSSGAMTNRIDRLEERGLVERKTGQNDRRSVIVRLTRAGREAVDEAFQFRLDAARNSLKGLGPDEQQQLADLLRTVVLGSDRRS